MKFQKIFQQHPDCYVIAVPVDRKKNSNHVKRWMVLQTCQNLEDARELVHDFHAGGLTMATVINTHVVQDDEQQEWLPPDMAAQFFRVFFGI